MKKEIFTYLSADNKTTIKAVKYLPDNGEVKAIFQIIHGMCEFIDRYDNFADFLCGKGYLVVGNDILGHGDSITSKDNWGYFTDDLENGYKVVDKDAHHLQEIIVKEYPNKPYFLLGHSMGAYFGQLYLMNYSKELNGAIIMGTGRKNYATLALVKAITRTIAASKGWHYRSSFINNLAIGGYNKKWEPSDNHVDWLTKDKTICDAYSKEPKCKYIFTLNAYYNLFSVIEETGKANNIKKILPELPILFTAGEEDVVGDFGKAPVAVAKHYQKLGMHDVDCKMYQNDRHEILNELDKEVVYNDIYNWLESKMTLR